MDATDPTATRASSLNPTAGKDGEISTMTLSSSADKESSVERIYLLLRPDLPLKGPAGVGVDGGGDVLAQG